MSTILLCTINARYIHASLSLRCLLANMGDLQEHTILQEYTLDNRCADMAEQILATKARIIGLAVYIWNAAESQALVRLLKAISPETTIVLGGPEVSHPPLRVDYGAADYIIQGEGELIFPALCQDILRDCAPSERVLAAEPVQLDQLHLPYDLYTDEDLAQRLVYVEASRGCPFACEFCLSSADKRMRFADPDCFLAELERLWQRGARTFKFIDRTFNSNVRVACRILDFFLDKEPPFHVHFECIPEYFPQELKGRLAAFPAGILQLEVGIQTLNKASAARISRQLDMARIQENIRFLQRETSAHLHLDLIIGLPGESAEQFGANLDALMALGHGEIQLGILKKLSGTRINRHDLEYGMVYSALPPYELMQTSLISFARMQELKRLARFWDLVYNSGNFTSTAPLLWPEGEVFAGFSAFCRWLYQETKSTWQIALPRLAELLFRFLTEEMGCDPRHIAARLAGDILVIKGRTLPALVREHLDHPDASCLAKPGITATERLTRRQYLHRPRHN